MKTFTNEDFNLYESHPQVNEAVEALNEAFRVAEMEVQAGRMTSLYAWCKFVSPVLEKYAHVGACDSDAYDCIHDCYDLHVKRQG